MTELTELIERLEAATGPDRTIDGDVALALGVVPPRYPNRSNRQRYLWSDNGIGLRANTWLAPNYTASIDAALALVERMLPGWQYAMGTCNEEDLPWACITEADEPCRDFTGTGPTLHLAILTALLRALSSAKAVAA